MKQDLQYILARRNRDRAVAVGLSMATSGGDASFARRMLLWVAADPYQTDYDLLRWGSRQRSAECLYHAVVGLEKLGEDSAEWRQRLLAYSRHRNPFVRLAGTAALVRRGDEARLPVIVRDATAANDVRVRGEALRWLGELSAERHISILHRALIEDHEVSNVPNAPAGEEAALALARLGTPEALTALVQGYFITPNHIVQGAIEDYLREQMVPPGEQREALRMSYLPNCRQNRFRDR